MRCVLALGAIRCCASKTQRRADTEMLVGHFCIMLVKFVELAQLCEEQHVEILLFDLPVLLLEVGHCPPNFWRDVDGAECRDENTQANAKTRT